MTMACMFRAMRVALSLGADRGGARHRAEAKHAQRALSLVRNGSRGAFWLEPLVEVGHARRPHCLWPGDRRRRARRSLPPTSFNGGHARPGTRADRARSPWFKGQQRLTFARVGIVDPASVADYVRMAATRAWRAHSR